MCAGGGGRGRVSIGLKVGSVVCLSGWSLSGCGGPSSSMNKYIEVYYG